MTKTGILKIYRAMPKSDSETVTLNKQMLTHLMIGIGGFSGGFFLLLTGLTLWIVTYFQLQRFHGLDVIMMVAALVLLGIGAHFFDKVDVEKKEVEKPRSAVKQEYRT